MSGKKPNSKFNGSRGITRKPSVGEIVSDMLESESQVAAAGYRDLAIDTLVRCMRAPSGKTGDMTIVNDEPVACSTYSQKISAAQTILAYADGRPGPMIRDQGNQSGLTVQIVMLSDGDKKPVEVVIPQQFESTIESPEVTAARMLNL